MEEIVKAQSAGAKRGSSNSPVLIAAQSDVWISEKGHLIHLYKLANEASRCPVPTT